MKSRKTKTIATYTSIAVLTVLPLTYTSALIRQAYVAIAPNVEQGDSPFSATNASIIQSIDWNFQLDVAGVALFSLNLGIFVLGLLLAYYRYDPHRWYERLYVDADRANRQLEDTYSKRDKDILRLQDAHDKEEMELQNQLKTKERQLTELRTKQKKIDYEIEEIKASKRHCIRAKIYRFPQNGLAEYED